MKIEGGLLISLCRELTGYFKDHPADLPEGVDVNTLNIKCSPYLIEYIENYSTQPYTDKFLWRLKFLNSKDQEFEYMYFITYKALHKGECGIVEARLISEKQDASDPSWYLAN